MLPIIVFIQPYSGTLFPFGFNKKRPEMAGTCILLFIQIRMHAFSGIWLLERFQSFVLALKRFEYGNQFCHGQ